MAFISLSTRGTTPDGDDYPQDVNAGFVLVEASKLPPGTQLSYEIKNNQTAQSGVLAADANGEIKSTFQADPKLNYAQIGQVSWNEKGNAWKTSSGEVTITLSALSLLVGKDQIEFVKPVAVDS